MATTTSRRPQSVLETPQNASKKYIFPSDLSSKRIARYMSFQLKRLVKPEADKPISVALDSQVCLPMPVNINDSYRYDYVSNPFGPAGEAVEEKALQDWLYAAGNALNQGVRSEIQSWFGKADSTAIAARVYGATNPMLYNQFGGLGFKQHSFFFTLVAKNKKESDSIRDIVEFFKYHSAPGFLNGRNFTNPNVFELKYNDVNARGVSVQNEYMPPFTSDCVLTDMAVLYNANGQSSFFKSGAPVDVQLSLNFSETEIAFKSRIYKNMVNKSMVQDPGL